MNNRAMQAVAVAAIEWNRARLVRIAVTKQHAEALKHYTVPAVNDARKAEARTKAALRKACERADPTTVVIDLADLG